IASTSKALASLPINQTCAARASGRSGEERTAASDLSWMLQTVFQLPVSAALSASIKKRAGIATRYAHSISTKNTGTAVNRTKNRHHFGSAKNQYDSTAAIACNANANPHSSAIQS